MKFSKREIKKAMFDIIVEYDKECVGWENLPSNPELQEKIMDKIKDFDLNN